MAKDSSFDLVSELDLQAVLDAVNVSKKEINNRFDFKGTGVELEFNKEDKTITFLADTDFQADQLKDILISKMIKRGLSPKGLVLEKEEKASGNKIRKIEKLVTGIEQEQAKKIVKDIKDFNKKVQASIQEDKLRISSKDKDVLQEVIQFIKKKDYPVPLQFRNYR